MDPFAVVALIIVPVFAVLLFIWGLCAAAGDSDEAMDRHVYNQEED